jgi:hypothetical protein
MTGEGGDESTMTGFDHEFSSSPSSRMPAPACPSLAYGSNRTGLDDRKRFEALVRVGAAISAASVEVLALLMLAVDVSTKGRYGA